MGVVGVLLAEMILDSGGVLDDDAVVVLWCEMKKDENSNVVHRRPIN
jgi:hypothetical protein